MDTHVDNAMLVKRPAPPRQMGLDLLRLLAILLVLGRHLHPPQVFTPFLHVWRTGGWVGVDLFFVLSGFLVSGLLFKDYLSTGSVDIKRFLIRRGFKIYPAFYALILFTLAVMLVTGEGVSRKRVLVEFLLVHNYIQTGGLWGHTWSLAVEEHFYIGIALLVYRLCRTHRTSSNPFSSIPIVFLACAGACLALRMATWSIHAEFSHRLLVIPTHLRVDSLMFGVLLSYFWHFRDLQGAIRRIHAGWLLLLGSVMLAPAFIYPIDEHTLVSVFGVVLFYLGSGALVLAATRLSSSSSRLLSICATLGAASYSIYLWHMPINKWGWDAFSRLTGITGFACYFIFFFAASLAVGLGMSKLLEFPALRLRDRLFPSVAARKPTG